MAPPRTPEPFPGKLVESQSDPIQIGAPRSPGERQRRKASLVERGNAWGDDVCGLWSHRSSGSRSPSSCFSLGTRGGPHSIALKLGSVPSCTEETTKDNA